MAPLLRPLIVLCLMVYPVAARAQISATANTSDVDEAAIKVQSLCFRPGPLPHCRSAILTEWAIASQRFCDGFSNEHSLQWSVGGLHNLDTHNSLGADLVFGPPVGTSHLGLDLRYRRWVTPRVSLDFMPGVMWVQGSERSDGARITAQTAVNISNFSLFIQMEQQSDDPRVYFGAKLGSWPGAALGLIAYSFVALQPET